MNLRKNLDTTTEPWRALLSDDRRAGRPALSGRSGLTPEPADGLRERSRDS